MSKMSCNTLGLSLLVMASLISGPTHAASDQDPAPASSADYVPSDADLAAANCVIGEERFLPGDYYYCLGGLTYGQHHYATSNRFFTTAASWASKPAQYVLGVMALNGDHQPKNRALALAWFALASERPDSRFKANYDEVYKASTNAERRGADALLEKMRPVYGDATAAMRAETRYADGMAWLKRMNSAGNQYCMEGMTPIDRLNPDPSVCQSVQQVVQMVDHASVSVFEGWAGHVTVGPLQQVALPPKSPNNSN
jgi:hypothetical protein